MAKMVLVVEDQDDNRKIVRDLLTNSGFEVIEAIDGIKGVQLARTHHPDLILMDIQLPGIDGYEATRQIKASDDTKGIPVIALTAHAMAGDKEKTLAAGCDDYDTKPIELPRLLEKINSMLEKAKVS